MAAGALLEGLGLALLVPLLAVLTHQQHGWLERITDHAFAVTGIQGHMSRLGLIVAAFVALMMVRAVVLIARDRAVVALQQGFIEREQIELVKSLGQAQWQDLVRLRHARIVQALTVELARVSAAITVMLQGVVAAAMLIAQLVLAALIAPWMTLLAAALIVSGIPIWLAILQREVRVGQTLSTDSLSLTDLTTQMLGGLKTAIAQNMQMAFIASFADTSRGMARKAIAHRRQQSRSTVISTTVAAFGGALLALAGGWLGVEPVAMIAALFVFARMAGQLRVLQQNTRQFAAFVPAYATLRDLHGELVASAVPQQAFPRTQRHHPVIVFDNVSYSYSGAGSQAVHAISLSITAGETIGISGPSGSGKTTFVDLLAGMIEPDTGMIIIGGIKLDSATAQSWRDAVSYVPQDAYLFNDTLRANLTWGLGDIDDGTLWQMLEFALVADVVEQAPSGLDTRVGERGARFSGGERQRLAIARALLRRPALLILDEGTSGLDTATEQRILSGLMALPDRPTICVVSHRAEALLLCERVVEIGPK